MVSAFFFHQPRLSLESTFSRQYTSRTNIIFTHHRYTHMAPVSWTANAYPPARRSDHYDTWQSEKHGQVKVHDPYEWLESNSDETERWELQSLRLGYQLSWCKSDGLMHKSKSLLTSWTAFQIRKNWKSVLRGPPTMPR